MLSKVKMIYFTGLILDPYNAQLIFYEDFMEKALPFVVVQLRKATLSEMT